MKKKAWCVTRRWFPTNDVHAAVGRPRLRGLPPPPRRTSAPVNTPDRHHQHPGRGGGVRRLRLPTGADPGGQSPQRAPNEDAGGQQSGPPTPPPPRTRRPPQCPRRQRRRTSAAPPAARRARCQLLPATGVPPTGQRRARRRAYARWTRRPAAAASPHTHMPPPKAARQDVMPAPISSQKTLSGSRPARARNRGHNHCG